MGWPSCAPPVPVRILIARLARDQQAVWKPWTLATSLDALRSGWCSYLALRRGIGRDVSRRSARMSGPTSSLFCLSVTTQRFIFYSSIIKPCRRSFWSPCRKKRGWMSRRLTFTGTAPRLASTLYGLRNACVLDPGGAHLFSAAPGLALVQPACDATAQVATSVLWFFCASRVSCNSPPSADVWGV